MPIKIYQRGKTWHCGGTFAGVSVKRQSLGVGDRELAEHKVFEIEQRIRLEITHGKASQETFGTACVRYHENHTVPAQMSRFLVPIIKRYGDEKLSSITPVMVRAWAKALYPHLKPQSWNTLVIVPISAVINHNHEAGVCNPIKIKRFKIKDARIARPIDDEWLDQFIRHAPPHLGALALFCFTTAARPTEACRLCPEDIKLDERRAYGGMTKNGKRRVYPIVDRMAALLRNLPPRTIKIGRFAGEQRVFGYLDRQALHEPWIETCKAAGLDYRTRYEAGKHSCLTQLVTVHGIDPVTAGALTNTTPAVLLRHYVKANEPERVAHEVFGNSQNLHRQARKNLKTVAGPRN